MASLPTARMQPVANRDGDEAPDFAETLSATQRETDDVRENEAPRPELETRDAPRAEEGEASAEPAPEGAPAPEAAEPAQEPAAPVEEGAAPFEDARAEANTDAAPDATASAAAAATPALARGTPASFAEPLARELRVRTGAPIAAPQGRAATPVLRDAAERASEATRVTASSRAYQRRAAPGAEQFAELHESLIKKIALGATEGSEELRVLLEPRELGSVALRLQLDGSSLRLEMSAESRDTAALLERQSARIVDELAALGLDVEDLDIGTSSRQEQRARHQDFAHEHASAPATGSPADADSKLTPAPSRAPAPAGLALGDDAPSINTLA